MTQRSPGFDNASSSHTTISYGSTQQRISEYIKFPLPNPLTTLSTLTTLTMSPLQWILKITYLEDAP